MIKAVFPFFIYTIPSNTLVCLILYFLFNILRKYKISQYLRKFYFFKSVLFQTLIEGNVIYFVYVCLGHLSTPFHFRFGDKMSLSFTLAFFWIVIMFTFTFYILIGSFLKKQASYFIYCYYRCNSGYAFVTAKNLLRNFLRGFAFYYFHDCF